MAIIHTIRFALYCALFLSATITTALCAARIHYTRSIREHIQIPDACGGLMSYGGANFYDPVAVQLLVTSALTMLWAPIVALTIFVDPVHPLYVSMSFLAEILDLSIFFFLWLVGAAIAFDTRDPTEVDLHWGNLSSCWSFSQCRTLTGMLTFAWLSWVAVLLLLVMSLLFATVNKAFRDPIHGQWNQNGSPHRHIQY